MVAKEAKVLNETSTFMNLMSLCTNLEKSQEEELLSVMANKKET